MEADPGSGPRVQEDLNGKVPIANVGRGFLCMTQALSLSLLLTCVRRAWGLDDHPMVPMHSRLT